MRFRVNIEHAGDASSAYRAALEALPHGTVLVDPSTGGAEASESTFALAGPVTGNSFQTFAGEEMTGEFPVRAAAFEQLARDLMIHVANFAPDRVFVHAGVVAVEGRGLMLPGTSFAGKSTLVAELVRAGATYHSDEYAVIDEEGRVHPYARDLQMRDRGGTTQRGLAPGKLGSMVGVEPVRVSHVLFARYVSGGTWAPEPVSPGMAVLEMLRHAIPVQRTPGRVMATLSRLMGSASAWQTERGEVEEAVPLLLRALHRGGDLR